MSSRWLATLVLPVLIATAMQSWSAQAPLSPGEFRGEVASIPVVLHVTGAADGSLGCTLDSPSQGAHGLPCADLRIEGRQLSFRVPAVSGGWTGTISDDAATLTGSWSQGAATPLVFRRDQFVPAAQPSPVDGIWLGRIGTQGPVVRAQLVVQSGRSGGFRCTVDVVEQQAFDVGCADAAFADGEFSFRVPVVDGRWHGRLATDGNRLDGTWTQRAADGSTTPPVQLAFARQDERIARPEPAPPTFDPAMSPVTPARLEAVLREALKQPLATGVLAPGTGIGVVVGVVTKEGRSVFALGAAQPDALFEIGSITKTFTGLALAQLIEQGKVRADTPVRELLPAGTVGKPDGAEITLLDLVTQHSGLPRMPDNFAPRDPANPYADYDAARLHDFIARQGVAKPADAPFLYSNVGLGLLGHALARAAGGSYAELVAAQVLRPLGMDDTAIALSPAQQQRFITGHAVQSVPGRAWDLDALAGAGALRSTAADMLKYLEAQLHPDVVATDGEAGRTLPAALRRSHTPQAEALPGMRIAYGWLQEPANGTYWHNGGTGGFTSYAFFNPQEGYAGIVLVNLAITTNGSLADVLGQHIRQRLAGQPAISLAHW